MTVCRQFLSDTSLAWRDIFSGSTILLPAVLEALLHLWSAVGSSVHPQRFLSWTVHLENRYVLFIHIYSEIFFQGHSYETCSGKTRHVTRWIIKILSAAINKCIFAMFLGIKRDNVIIVGSIWMQNLGAKSFLYKCCLNNSLLVIK